MPSIQRRTGQSVDDVDLALLAHLQADARIAVAELSRRVKLSAPAVSERLARLERDRVVVGYRAEIDPRALELSLTVVIRIRPSPGQLPNVAKLARETPEIIECLRITGEDCFIMRAHMRDVEHLEEVIDRFIVLGQTTTSIVQSAPVPARPVALPAVAVLAPAS
jgi:Lrp/AsnC family leucine-responsive transcriptional regulator